MNESILNALMHLFAIIANVNEAGVTTTARSIVEAYLRQQLSQKYVEKYLKLFDNYIEFHLSEVKEGKRGKKRISSNSVKVLKICEQINESLHQKEKIIVLLRIIEFVETDGHITLNEYDFIKTVADTFNISDSEFYNIKAFALHDLTELHERENAIVLNNSEDFNLDGLDGIKHIHNEFIEGQVLILYISSIETFVFSYQGKQVLYLNGQPVQNRRAQVLDHGSIIRGPKFSLYHTEIASKFLSADISSKIYFNAENIEFKFKNSKNGLHPLNFSEESGQLIGIMGGSGVGKSTLFNILIGKYQLNNGRITINGRDVSKEKKHLEGVIGYVPQDDLLIEELTVYQNLYFNAKLCFSDFNEQQINQAVDKILNDLDLYETKHLIVGNPLNKTISGGQRKRLNIALELIRQPAILFVDEPTSGLSSMDSEMVMQLLKHQAIKGRLVIVNIHQPSSDIYKLFDKLWIMDKGGYVIYNGNPIDALVYFKTMTSHINAEESECPTCGNVNPEQILQIVESKVVNEFGKYTTERKVTPEEWYQLYKQNIEAVLDRKCDETAELPKSSFKVPNAFKQFKVFAIRNILSKIANKQYMLINFLEAPILAFILGFFTKYLNEEGLYVFADNKNIPVYIFMNIVVALFIGLTVSAEEIIRDRKILEREKFLNLSRFSYINSKVLILFAISAIQMFTFVLVGNTILEIKGMGFSYWFVLFSTAAAANMIGLNISSALNSVITIYILIPFILVPQLLLGGAMVDFDDLHKSITKKMYVPVLGDMMISRWSYEALAVHQFKSNKFEKHFFQIERDRSNATYIASYLVTELENRLDKALKINRDADAIKELKHVTKVLTKEFTKLIKNHEIANISTEFLEKLNSEQIDENVVYQAKEYLYVIKDYYNQKTIELGRKKDEKFKELFDSYGKDDVIQMQQLYHNKKLSDFLLNKTQTNMTLEVGNELIRKKDPIFYYPNHNFGRAHFYAPVKKLFGKYYDTFWFNLGVIWTVSIMLYFALLGDLLKRIMEYLTGITFKIKKGKSGKD